jgi:hypothetical protein
MSTSTNDVRAKAVKITGTDLSVELEDGRTIIVPLAWFPRLIHGKPAERKHWRLIGKGVGIHWPDLDEDISVENLLDGQQSGESQRSLERWLLARTPKAKRSR